MAIGMTSYLVSMARNLLYYLRKVNSHLSNAKEGRFLMGFI